MLVNRDIFFTNKNQHHKTKFASLVAFESQLHFLERLMMCKYEMDYNLHRQMESDTQTVCKSRTG